MHRLYKYKTQSITFPSLQFPKEKTWIRRNMQYYYYLSLLLDFLLSHIPLNRVVIVAAAVRGP